MSWQLCSLNFLRHSTNRLIKKPFLHQISPILVQGSSVADFSSSTRSYYQHQRNTNNFRPQQSSVFRSLLAITGIIGGVALIVYVNPTTRDYVVEFAPQLNPYVLQFDDFIRQCKLKVSSFQLPKVAAVLKLISPGPDNRFEEPSTVVNVNPTFPSTSDVNHRLAECPEHLQSFPVDLRTATRNSAKASLEALADLRSLRDITEHQLDEFLNASLDFDLPSSVARSLDAAQRKATSSHQAAREHLTKLRSTLDSIKLDSTPNNELLKEAVARYGDIDYELSRSVAEVRNLQNRLALSIFFARSAKAEKAKLIKEVNAILPKPVHGSNFVKEDGSMMTSEEVNSLLTTALERIDKIYASLEDSGASAKRQLAAAIRANKVASDCLIQESVQCAISRERNNHELERFEWERQSKAGADHQHSVDLAHHGHHLAQMLRLKQDELEEEFGKRLREALALQKAAIEGDIRCWIRRMNAIEHVVEGRADIDRVAKETQALWLAVEAFAFALELPFSRIGASGTLERQSELKPFYTSEPLRRFVDAIKDTAGERHEFANIVVDSIPRPALTDGVWTRQGLLQRFNKVYKTACNVELVSETGGSLWNYTVSWLQSKLLFDSLGRRRVISRLPGLGSTLLTPETELPDDGQSLENFAILTSARAALMPEADAAVNVDPTNCADIEFAVRLLSQLKGQAAAVADDWVQDARRFLEVYQAIQALLAYTTAQNISAFEERL